MPEVTEEAVTPIADAPQPLGGTRLAELVCARICHDFVGPLGALSGAAELLAEGAVDPAEGIAAVTEAAGALGRRLRFLRVAWGGAGEGMTPPELAALAEGVAGHGRVRLDLSALPADAPLGPALARALLNAILLAGEAMPRGGVIRVLPDPAAGRLLVQPDGPGAAWPPALSAAIAGRTEEASPRTVVAPLAVALAASSGLALSLVLAPSGAPPLLAIGTAPRPAQQGHGAP